MTEPGTPVLRDIESKLAGLVEGTFGRMFRSEVTPAELARGLAREMESSRRQGLDRTWVAHHYDVYLSPDDHRRIADGSTTLADELAANLVLHAREQRFALAHAPTVVFHRGDELPTSRYGVRASHDDAPSAAAAQPDPGRGAQRTGGAASVGRPRDPQRTSGEQPVGRPREPQRTGGADPIGRPREPQRPADPAAPRPRGGGAAPAIVLTTDGRREPVPLSGGTVGRSRDCEVVIASAEVSRHHMELRPRGDGWLVWDLGSTNGVRLNGRDVGGPGDAAPLQIGDRIELGTVVLRVEDDA